jgi:hypothetical protein
LPPGRKGERGARSGTPQARAVRVRTRRDYRMGMTVRSLLSVAAGALAAGAVDTGAGPRRPVKVAWVH